ncbi:MAG: hypothetical protein ABI977_16515, partial [Acidobacteriota bacterium]
MTRPKTFGLAACVLALIAGLGAVASAQERSANQQIKNNPLLEQHSNFFKKKVYDLHKDPKSSKYFPPDLSYQAYSAVGYDLANTIVL